MLIYVYVCLSTTGKEFLLRQGRTIAIRHCASPTALAIAIQTYMVISRVILHKLNIKTHSVMFNKH